MASLSALVTHLYDDGFDQLYRSYYAAVVVTATIPVVSAGCERSFSKLEFIKHCLRSSMGDDRCNSFILMSVEAVVLGEVGLDKMVEDFCAKARRITV